MSARHADDLKAQILDSVQRTGALRPIATRWGTQYRVRVPISGPAGQAHVMTICLLRTGTTQPKLTTLYVDP
jgi:hypothetical protein